MSANEGLGRHLRHSLLSLWLDEMTKIDQWYATNLSGFFSTADDVAFTFYCKRRRHTRRCLNLSVHSSPPNNNQKCSRDTIVWHQCRGGWVIGYICHPAMTVLWGIAPMPYAIVIVLANATPLSPHNMLTVGERQKEWKLRFPLIPPTSLQPHLAGTEFVSM